MTRGLTLDEVPIDATYDAATLDWNELWSSVRQAAESALPPAPAETVDRWERWRRGGWLTDRATADDLVTLAIAAGNAATISRRTGIHRTLFVPHGWQVFA